MHKMICSLKTIDPRLNIKCASKFGDNLLISWIGKNPETVIRCIKDKDQGSIQEIISTFRNYTLLLICGDVSIFGDTILSALEIKYETNTLLFMSSLSNGVDANYMLNQN